MISLMKVTIALNHVCSLQIIEVTLQYFKAFRLKLLPSIRKRYFQILYFWKYSLRKRFIYIM